MSIRIDVAVIPAEMPEQGFAGKAVAVIDVLRASTSMVAALEAGAKEIIPLASIEETTRLAETMGRETVVLCGERDGNKINGFDLGNSPLEFTPEKVKGKSLLMATTNGTVAVARAKGASLIAVGCLINAKALVPVLTGASAEIVLLCSGKQGRVSLEDLLCAGYLTKLIKDQSPDAELNDGARVARDIYEKHKGRLTRAVRESDHGSYLAGLGYLTDIEYATQPDASSTVPVMKDGRIVKI
ncbi:2-phosphosulfolactate phosphatase [candidate division TA06 bacterium]|uniref:Probable 2-phosphosulfolactate phosphatase n=1 Tax=candidate division TA06 bacterium TaxID=2250710 RepID=A0A933I8V0_UNCT6|nr:2-phosphosulfolactate phosphatase [candidate division TA06 bacterium]